MADADDVRRLALSLPHVVEVPSAGFDFRVDDKGFVWSYPERRPGRPRVIRTDVAVLYVGDLEEQQALLLGEPDRFFTAPGYENAPLVMLRLDRVDAESPRGARHRRLADAGTRGAARRARARRRGQDGGRRGGATARAMTAGWRAPCRSVQHLRRVVL